MTIQEIELKLRSSKSSDRKLAARSIGKLALKELGGELLNAYIKEKKDVRTWETKLEMILSLGLIDHKAALPEIEIIIKTNLALDAVTSVAARTYVRLKRKSINDAAPVIELLKTGGLSVVSGALNTLGNDRMMPSDEEINELIKLSWDLHRHKDRVGKEFGLMDPRYGLAFACAGWDRHLTRSFLDHCLDTTSEKEPWMKVVVESSFKGKYGIYGKTS